MHMCMEARITISAAIGVRVGDDHDAEGFMGWIGSDVDGVCLGIW